MSIGIMIIVLNQLVGQLSAHSQLISAEIKRVQIPHRSLSFGGLMVTDGRYVSCSVSILCGGLNSRRDEYEIARPSQLNTCCF